MKLSKVARAGLVVGSIMASTISYNTASAQVSTSGSGPYYATPSWDQKITTGRFVVLSNWNNEAVLDRETGVVWEQSPDTGFRSWFESHNHCNRRIKGGRTGWRLPSQREMASLYDPTVPGGTVPTLPPGHPFSNVSTLFFYWSATTDPSDTTRAFLVAFVPVHLSDPFPKSTNSLTWCARGGAGVDTP